MSIRTRPASRISRTVVLLGAVSLLSDVSSEGIYPLIPLFLINVLHAQVSAVGLIEGIAESSASILRIFSGRLSDVLGNRKWIATAGYSLSTVSKPLFALAASWPQVLGIRFADRVGKGIRTAPRDALIADVTPAAIRGVSFGLHRTMDTIGAVTGPLLALWLLGILTRGHGYSIPHSYRTIFLLSAIPATLAVLILVFFVKEQKSTKADGEMIPSLSLKSLGKPFKLFLLVTVVFAIGNSSDAFLILRAQNLGISPSKILLIYVVFNSVEAIFATGAGAVSDKVGRRNVVLAGYLVFAVVYLGFALARHAAAVWALFAVYGLYNALTLGVQKAFATDLIPAGLRGTGLGAYHMLAGLALLPASVIAGLLWERLSPAAPFFFGASTAAIAALLIGMLFRSSATCTDR